MGKTDTLVVTSSWLCKLQDKEVVIFYKIFWYPT